MERLELRASFADPALRDGADRVGLAGVLAGRSHRARRVTLPGTAAVEAFRWRFRDGFSQTWWPQGIAIGEHLGMPLLITSWFAQPKRGVRKGSRISVVDLRDRTRPRYRHVLLVSPRRETGRTVWDPVHVHAGGIVWADDRLLVAATFGGIREFRLSDIIRTPSRGLWRRPAGLFGYRYVMPEFATYQQDSDAPGEEMRYSFVSLEVTDATDSANDATGVAGELRLVVGEYRKDTLGRLGRLLLTDDRAVVDEIHNPGIPEMQGAVARNGRWFVSAGRGDKRNGDLWTGTGDRMTRHPGVLPPGPEDLALSGARDRIWSVTEFPGKRWIYAIDPREVDNAE